MVIFVLKMSAVDVTKNDNYGQKYKGIRLSTFKTKLSKLIRPTPKLVYGIHDPKGLAILTQLRVGLSKLNFDKFRHNFRDTVNHFCPTNDGV